MTKKVELDGPKKDGSTLRDHYKHVERHTGKQMFDEPIPPQESAHIWEWFWELNPSRSSGAMGDPGALTFSEIDAWARLTLATPEHWEVMAIKQMDTAFLTAYGKLK